jgi:protein tyrosine/serine phosphatase
MLIVQNRKVLGLMASGYRADAIKIIASQVMTPRGLIGLAQDTLDCAGAEIREIFDILTKDDSYPILIHCTQGKDRTGLIILLLLFLVADALSEAQQSIPLDAMASDYMKSEAELLPELETLMKEITDIGLDEEYVKTPPAFTGSLKSYIDTKYGGVRGYLRSIGVGEEKINRVASLLMT